MSANNPSISIAKTLLILLVLPVAFALRWPEWYSTARGNRQQVTILASILELRDERESGQFRGVPVDMCSASKAMQAPPVSPAGYEPTQSCFALASSQFACLSGQVELARTLAAAAEDTCPRTELVLLWNAQMAWLDGDLDRALALLLQEEQSAVLMIDWARSLSQQGHLDESRRLYEQALPRADRQLSPLLFAVRYQELGKIYGQLGMWPEAVTAYERSTELVPDRWNFWFETATAYGHIEAWSLAIQSLDRAIALIPESHANRIGMLYQQRGLIQRAAGMQAPAVDSFLIAYCQAQSDVAQTGVDLQRLERDLLNLSQEIGIPWPPATDPCR